MFSAPKPAPSRQGHLDSPETRPLNSRLQVLILCQPEETVAVSAVCDRVAFPRAVVTDSVGDNGPLNNWREIRRRLQLVTRR